MKEILLREEGTVGTKRSKVEEKMPQGPPPYLSTAFVTTVFFMPPGLRADQVVVDWLNAMDRLLDKFHKIDKSVCIVDPNGDAFGGKGKKMYGKRD